MLGDLVFMLKIALIQGLIKRFVLFVGNELIKLLLQAGLFGRSTQAILRDPEISNSGLSPVCQICRILTMWLSATV
ncbi:MAG: hypothetical protein R3E95_03625 [Thiolinea sp.]